ncbi:MAG: hypothetical protein DI598_17765 [Pseudopedobacter saltans]|uniref:Uncharacterized protein n=1 Tax=Pseudopedobacter saltans TaxID=151895 RepID=A0A2W5EH42_9SPHI|nr:MAG: hypothetical protein DI598_17765 [Pseudopedobacter saltans]
MQYISPIRFFEQLDIPTEDISDVKKLKKIVHLEFLSSETGIFNIDGFDYNKQDLLNLLSDEKFEQHWHFHQMIWNNKYLLDLLERESVDIKQLREILEFRNNADFCQFVSPYFVQVFSNIMKILLNEQYVRDVYLWLQCKYYINKEEEEIAYDSLRKYLDDALFLFRNINNANYESRLSSIERWESSDWSSVLNALPDCLYHYVDSIAEGLTNVLVIVQYNEKSLCYTISSWLVKVHISSPYLNETIKDNHRIFGNNAPSFTQTSSKPNSFWSNKWIYFVSVIIAKVLIFNGLVCNTNSNKDYLTDKSGDYTKPFITQPPTTSDVVTGDEDAKTKEREIVHNALTLNDIERKFYHAYQGSSIKNSGSLGQKSYGNLPIYLAVFDGKSGFLHPFKIENKTNQNLSFIYLSGNNSMLMDLQKGKTIYCDPNENQSMDFLLDNEFTNAAPVGVAASFAMNGAQSIALGVGGIGEVKLIDNTNHFIVDTIKDVNKKYDLTISITKKDDKFHFDTKGTKVFHLTKK